MPMNALSLILFLDSFESPMVKLSSTDDEIINDWLLIVTLYVPL